jgi:hypothetical protein
VQYDSQSNTVGWQLRFRWIRRPGNDTFFVYTQNWVDSVDERAARRWATIDQRGVFKIVQTWRF